MKILLDTHLLIWCCTNSKTLSQKALSYITDVENEIFFQFGKYLGNPNKVCKK